MSKPKRLAAAGQRPKTTLTDPVIICDDHLAVRAGVAAMLTEEKIPVAGSCNTLSELLVLIKQYSRAVIITDLAIEQVPFPTFVAKLHQASAHCKIIVYSMREAPATIGLCYEAGALAFIPKSAGLGDLVKAIEHARRGERYIPPAVAAELANYHINRTAPTHVLSARELEIFVGYARDRSVQRLAKQFNLSEKTVENLVSQIAKKLDVPRSTFNEVARRNGLLDFMA